MRNLTADQLEALLPKIQLIPIEEIHLNPKNPRTIRESDFKKLVNSVDTFWQMLFLRPLVLDEDGMVLGGNMRLQAGRKLGFPSMPCIYASHLSHQQRAEFVVKDNVPFGEWNFDDLANNWDAKLLADWGMKVPSWDLTGENDFGGSGAARSGSTKQTGPRAPSFNIMLKADTELARQALITKLKKAGLVEDQDFVLL
jgi:hypothetical protein